MMRVCSCACLKLIVSVAFLFELAFFDQQLFFNLWLIKACSYHNELINIYSDSFLLFVYCGDNIIHGMLCLSVQLEGVTVQHVLAALGQLHKQLSMFVVSNHSNGLVYTFVKEEGVSTCDKSCQCMYVCMISLYM